jgi:hypothetical protein
MVTPDDVGLEGPGYASAAALAERANGGNPKGGWRGVEAQALEKGAAPSYCVGRSLGDSVLSCMPGSGFPLAGAAYTQISRPSVEDIYLCSRGCSQTGVTMIPDTAYEEATVFGKPALRTIRRFEHSCRGEAERARFFRSERKRQKRSSER